MSVLKEKLAKAEQRLEHARSRARPAAPAQRVSVAKPRTIRRRAAGERKRLQADIEAYDNATQGEVVAFMLRTWEKLPPAERPAGANDLLAEYKHLGYAAAVKALTDADGTFSLARCARIKSLTKMSGRTWEWVRQWFGRRWDGTHNPRYVLLAGEPGTARSADVLGPYFPSAAALSTWNHAERARIGLTVRLSEGGRAASVDEVQAAHFAFAQSAAASAGGFVVGTSSAASLAAGVCCLVLSSDAGCFASHGQQRNWTCAVLRDACRRDGNCSTDAAIPLDVGAVSDKVDGLDLLFHTHKEAINFLCRHGQLPCCADRLAHALRACICKEVLPARPPAATLRAPARAIAHIPRAPSPPLPPARPPAAQVLPDGKRRGPCNAVAEAGEAALPLCCYSIPGDETSPPRAAWTPCCVVYTGDLVNLHAVLGLGSHRTDPTRFSTHVIKEGTGKWVLRSVLVARRLAHSVVGVPCPVCNYTPSSEEDVASERAKREEMSQVCTALLLCPFPYRLLAANAACLH
jgi:hypothetical protein